VALRQALSAIEDTRSRLTGGAESGHAARALGVGAQLPAGEIVAGEADGAAALGDAEEVAELVVVRVVAGGALELAALAEDDARVDEFDGAESGDRGWRATRS
jgi:hypothetical protein